MVSDRAKPLSKILYLQSIVPVLLFILYLMGAGLIPANRVFAQLSGAQVRIQTNVQSGAAYALQVSDCGKLISFSNSNPVAVTIPQAGASGLAAGCWMDIQNTGTGTVTLTPAGTSIDAAPSVQLTMKQGLRLVSTGTAYLTQRGQGSGGSGGGSGSGTVTAVSGSLTPGAIVTGNGATDIRTVAAAATMDSDGNLSLPGSVAANTACQGCAGAIDLASGNDPGIAQGANTFSLVGPASLAASFRWKVPSADAAGAIASDGAGTLGVVPFSGTGNLVRTTSPVLSAATLIQPVIANYRAGSLPATSVSGAVAYVTDGSSTSDCTSGGGTYKVFCTYNGANWASPGGSAGAAKLLLVGYEVGAENASGALTTADLSSHGIVINGSVSRTLLEASCISDSGNQVITVKNGGTTLFTIHCVAYGSYSSSTTDGTTGYLTASAMNSTAVSAGARLDLSGTANGTTRDIKLMGWAQ